MQKSRDLKRLRLFMSRLFAVELVGVLVDREHPKDVVHEAEAENAEDEVEDVVVFFGDAGFVKARADLVVPDDRIDAESKQEQQDRGECRIALAGLGRGRSGICRTTRCRKCRR